MLKHFRVLAQLFFSFSFVKSLSHCILTYIEKPIKVLSKVDLVYMSKKFFSCKTYVCLPNVCSSTARKIFMLVQLQLS